MITGGAYDRRDDRSWNVFYHLTGPTLGKQQRTRTTLKCTLNYSEWLGLLPPSGSKDLTNVSVLDSGPLKFCQVSINLPGDVPSEVSECKGGTTDESIKYVALSSLAAKRCLPFVPENAFEGSASGRVQSFLMWGCGPLPGTPFDWDYPVQAVPVDIYGCAPAGVDPDTDTQDTQLCPTPGKEKEAISLNGEWPGPDVGQICCNASGCVTCSNGEAKVTIGGATGCDDIGCTMRSVLRSKVGNWHIPEQTCVNSLVDTCYDSEHCDVAVTVPPVVHTSLQTNGSPTGPGLGNTPCCSNCEVFTGVTRCLTCDMTEVCVYGTCVLGSEDYPVDSTCEVGVPDNMLGPEVAYGVELSYPHILMHLSGHPPMRDKLPVPNQVSKLSKTEGNSNCPVVASVRSECNLLCGSNFMEDMAICVEVVQTDTKSTENFVTTVSNLHDGLDECCVASSSANVVEYVVDWTCEEPFDLRNVMFCMDERAHWQIPLLSSCRPCSLHWPDAEPCL